MGLGFRVDGTEQDAVQGAGRQRGQAAVRLARRLVLCAKPYSIRLAPRLTAGGIQHKRQGLQQVASSLRL